jgi:hypothetical protein
VSVKAQVWEVETEEEARVDLSAADFPFRVPMSDVAAVSHLGIVRQ